jgi:polar amino acid transport system substrate-binding protein
MQEYKEGATMDAPTILKANDPRVADLVRAGRIRLGLFLPLYTEGPVTRELRGALGVGALAHEIARAIAARLRIEVQVVGFPTPPTVVECLKAGACDVGFMGIEPSRVSEVDFSPPVVRFDYTYLVPAGSFIRLIADADQPKIRIAVVGNHASTLALSRILKQAELVYGDTPDPTFELLRTGHADVMASARRILLEYSTQLPGSRVLEDHYGMNLVGMAVPKGQPWRLAYISEFIEEAKTSWLVQQTIERLGGRELELAPPASSNDRR